MSEKAKEGIAIVQSVIAGAVLALLTWQVYTTHEMTKNQTLLMWRVDQLEKIGHER